MRAGVFEKAVAKVNSLAPQPEFVLSVGDLIDGYTQTPAVWERQWDEFDTIIARLRAPFHVVVGNHDISNEKMRPAWTQRRGDAHYAFTHKNVLFLVLDSEDITGGGLGNAQVEFGLKTLEGNPAARWTFVFVHRPLWLEKDRRGFEKIEPALRGRNHTVFAGHLHHYIKDTRNGMAYYVLATAGGGSELRGEAVGEFDHITTVTLPECGPPQVVNHALDSDRVIPDDVLTLGREGRAAVLRDGSWLAIAPIVLDSEKFRRLEILLTLRNPESEPLRVTGTLVPQNGLHFTPDALDTTIPAGETKTLALAARSDSSAAQCVHALNEAGPVIMLSAAYEMPSGPVTLPASRPMLVDWVRAVPRSAAPIPMELHGSKPDPAIWPDSLFTTVTRPMFIKESWDWRGPSDGVFRFAVQQGGDGALHVIVETTDDRLVTNRDPLALQDRIIVTMQTNAGAVTMEATCGIATKDLIAEVRPASDGMIARFALPLPGNERRFRLNIGWVDVDHPENAKPSILWWRPPAESAFGWFEMTE